jgi:hypothetical protein
MPNENCMNGRFKAVSNTISGLSSGDQIIYLPLNVEYGTSPFDTYWFQFGVWFFSDHSISWGIWVFHNGNHFDDTYIDLTYQEGHVYDFSFSYEYSNHRVIFNIEDTNTSSSWNSDYYSVPSGSHMMYDIICFSPASCVEGYTTSGSLDNVPFFPTTIGEVTTHYHEWNLLTAPFLPSGISTGVWTCDSSHYYWAMCGQVHISNLALGGTGVYGDGRVSNPSAIIGDRDDICATIYGEHAGDGGVIIGQLSQDYGGEIYVRTGLFASGRLWVYVSMDGSHWDQVNSIYVGYYHGPMWHDIGSYMGYFKYIAVAGYDPNLRVNLLLDAVSVGADPEVTVLAYDESSSSYVSGVPISVDGGDWVSSGDVVWLSSVDHTFEAADLDGEAFNYFFDGTNYYYDNPADIPITSDMTITAYYHYIPTYTLTVNANYYADFDVNGALNTAVYIDGSYAGITPLSIELPMGFHEVYVNDTVWNPDLDIFNNFGQYSYYGVQNPSNVNPQIILLLPDITVSADFSSFSFLFNVDSTYGTVSDPENLVGICTDGQFAQIEGYGPYYEYGWISGAMNAPSVGHIYVYGYGWNNGPLYVYASEDGSNWELVSTPTVGDNLGWIDCGICNDPCNYLKFTAEDPNNVYTIYLDSVRVQPVYYQTLSISTDGEGYTSPSGNPVYERNTYAGVTAYAAPAWIFDHWTIDGNYAGNNPTIYIYIDCDYDLVAHFSEASSLQWLTVNAYDAYLGEYYPYEPNIYVDGYYMGTAPVSLQVAAGRDHTVTVDYSLYSPYWGQDAYLVDFTGDYNGYYWDNTVYFYANQDTTINALYLPQWFLRMYNGTDTESLLTSTGLNAVSVDFIAGAR